MGYFSVFQKGVARTGYCQGKLLGATAEGEPWWRAVEKRWVGGGSILRGLVLRGGEVGGCGDGCGVDARVDGPLQYLHDTAEGWRSKDSRDSRNQVRGFFTPIFFLRNRYQLVWLIVQHG